MTSLKPSAFPKPDFLSVERCIVELQRGREVVLFDEMNSQAMSLVETLTPESFDAVMSSGEVTLALSPARADALGYPCNTDVAELPLAPDASFTRVMEIVGLRTVSPDPAMMPPRPMTESPLASAALRLTRQAHALPAVLLYSKAAYSESILRARVQDVVAFERDTGALIMSCRTRIPLVGAESVELCVFRERHGTAEHVAIVVGHPDLSAPTRVRLHSSCFTGDILGSLRCDCGEQLSSAIATMAADQGGVIIYLSQEGRGIGLSNKLRAYQLQDEGLDTLEANRHLGFDEDERQYQAASTILAELGIQRIRLLTNNPLKIEALRHQGIEVVERLPSLTSANPHNMRYLETKRLKAGHLLGTDTIA